MQSEITLKLIAENKVKHAQGEDARVLDLGNCSLSLLPPQVLECFWVEALILSSNWEEYDLENKKWKQLKSKNKGNINRIIALPPALFLLPLLKRLIFSGNQVVDLSPLAGLDNLQQLECSDNQIVDLSPLVGLNNLQQLYCSDNQIVDLAPLMALKKLQQLDCSSNKITNLSPLTSLKKLQQLDCDSNQIYDLLPLSALANLQKLDCSFNQITDLSPLSGLYNLQKIYCDSNQLANLSALANLNNLQRLDCSSNKIIDLSPLANLHKLQQLYCSFNQIDNLLPLANLNHLQRLYCDSNKIVNLLPIKNLINLERLDCSSNEVFDLSAIANLHKLQQLYCSFNQIDNLLPIVRLNHLQRLDCESNKIADLSPILPLIRKELIKINVNDCPLITPPVEFAQAGNEAILEYFDQLGDDRTPLNEIKVIFLGEGAVGKTSLIKRIRNEEFDVKESQTHGIRICKTPFIVGDDTIQAHIWDFGGQEVMHATHQFFLSHRCIYVLVLNSRTDEKAEYWLKHASSFGGESPVLVVLNKMDENPGYDVNRKHLLEKHPQIVDFHKVSCKLNKGVEAFKTALAEQIANADTCCTPFPKAWAEVKDHFANMKEDYIDSSVFRKICINHGVERAFSQDVLLHFLHDLGVVINFKHIKNFDTQILNPLWLTNGVYRVINSTIVADAKGLLRENELDSIINDQRYKVGNTQDKPFHYPKGKLTYIIKVMEVFELCSRLDADTYVIPQLLPVDEPTFTLEGPTLHFVVRFPEFLPDSVFPRLMVKLNPYIKERLRWRTGMVLYKPSVFKAHARIRADKEDKEISMDLCGEEPRRLLSYIRATIEEITTDFAKLEFNEMVPVPATNRFIEYQDLIAAEKAGEKEIFVRELKKRIPIAHLLDGVEDAIMREEVSHIPVNVFISYSHNDIEHLGALRAALSPLERLNKLRIWDNRDIDAGLEWEKEIFRELAEADIVLCLVSADFIGSEFCYSRELAVALEAHLAGSKVVVPVRLRKCAWESLPIATLRSTPTNDWVTSRTNKDEVWTEVAHYLEPLASQIKEEKIKKKEERDR